MFQMKRKALVPLLCFLLGILNSAQAETKNSLVMMTGGTAGVYYPLGNALTRILNAHLADVEIAVEVGGGSIANVNRIAAHEAAMGLVQNDVVFRAGRGDKPFREPVTNLRMIASLYPEQVQCITSKNGRVKTFSDIRGKRVSVGAPGSGVADSLGAILSVAGIKYSDMDTDFLDFADTAERLQHDRLDVGFVLAGYPTAVVASLAEQKEIDLVAFESELLDALVESYPYFVKDSIPAGTYKGVDHDTPVPAVMAVLVCDADLPEELVYGITKAIFEHLDELKPIHEKAKAISLETALEGASVAVHPGAAKYYAENGLEIPEL